MFVNIFPQPVHQRAPGQEQPCIYPERPSCLEVGALRVFFEFGNIRIVICSGSEVQGILKPQSVEHYVGSNNQSDHHYCYGDHFECLI